MKRFMLAVSWIVLVVSGAGYLVVFEWKVALAVLALVLGLGLKARFNRVTKLEGAPENFAQAAERLTLPPYRFSVSAAHNAVSRVRRILESSGEDNPAAVWKMLAGLCGASLEEHPGGPIEKGVIAALKVFKAS